jgi:hypothetical protein
MICSLDSCSDESGIFDPLEENLLCCGNFQGYSWVQEYSENDAPEHFFWADLKPDEIANIIRDGIKVPILYHKNLEAHCRVAVILSLLPTTNSDVSNPSKHFLTFAIAVNLGTLFKAHLSLNSKKISLEALVFCAYSGARELTLNFTGDDSVIILTGRLRSYVLASFDEFSRWLKDDPAPENQVAWDGIDSCKKMIKGDLVLVVENANNVYLEENEDQVIDLQDAIHFVSEETVSTQEPVSNSLNDYTSFVSASSKKRIIKEEDLESLESGVSIPPFTQQATFASAVLLAVMSDTDGVGVSASALRSLRWLAQNNDDNSWAYLFMDEDTRNALLKVMGTVETSLKAKLLALKAGGNGQKDSPAVGSLIVHDFGKSDVRIMLVNKVYEGKTRDDDTVRPL